MWLVIAFSVALCFHVWMCFSRGLRWKWNRWQLLLIADLLQIFKGKVHPKIHYVPLTCYLCIQMNYMALRLWSSKGQKTFKRSNCNVSLWIMTWLLKIIQIYHIKRLSYSLNMHLIIQLRLATARKDTVKNVHPDNRSTGLLSMSRCRFPSAQWYIWKRKYRFWGELTL